MTTFTATALRSLLGTHLGVDVDEDTLADPGTRFDDVEVDSLGLFELFSAVEQAYGVVVPDDLIGDLDRPTALLAYVGERLETAA
jgi:acyl carrier protein